MRKFLIQKSSQDSDKEDDCASISDSSIETASEESEEEETVVAQKSKKRKFCPAWLNKYSVWLQQKKNHSGFDAAYCKVCQCFLKTTSGNADLLNHSKTKKHIERSNAIQIQPTIVEKLQNNNNAVVAKQFELSLCAFIAEHNVPLACADHLTTMIKQNLKDSKLSQHISCGRTKTSCLIENVIGRAQFEFVCDLLKTNKFSLCADESTDISCKKSMCLVVRVCQTVPVQDFFFALLEVTACDAMTLYKDIKNFFESLNIDYKSNMIGFAADGAPNMTGKNHSVAQLFKNDIPHLFILKCVCHSLALCSSNACLTLPSAVETLVRDIYNYIGNSPKRTDQFNKIATILDFKPKKMLHPAQTRWLSLEAVVARVLELYEPLKIFFAFAVNVDQIDNAKSILENLNETNEMYLCFLKYILQLVNQMNKIFQSERVEIHNVYNNMRSLYSNILNNFINSELLISNNNIHEIEYKKDINLLPLHEIYLGYDVAEKLCVSSLHQNEKYMFIKTCVKFYVELCSQLNKRFDFSDDNLKDLQFMNPQTILKKKNFFFEKYIQPFSKFNKARRTSAYR